MLSYFSVSPKKKIISFSDVHAVTARPTTVTVICDDTTIIRHRETFYNDRGFSNYVCLDLSLFCFVFWIFLTSAEVIKMHFKKYKSFQCNVIRNMNSDLGLIDGVWSNERNNRKWKLIVAVDRDNREIMHISMCSFQQ